MRNRAERWWPAGASLPPSLILALALALGALDGREARGQGHGGAAEVSREQVERSIRDGVAFLLKSQRPDGGFGSEAGEGALATLALLTAGESAESPPLQRALKYLQDCRWASNRETYTRSLLAMAFAAADPAKYRPEIFSNAERLEGAQARQGNWTYNMGFGRGGGGDNSNTQYALLGLYAAHEAGFPVQPDTWRRARVYWEQNQGSDGGWGYNPGGGGGSTGSMTCAGISSLIITGLKRVRGREQLVGDRVERCGEEGVDPSLQRGLDWMATHFDVHQNPMSGITWHYYYLYGLERVGRLSGRRFFGENDWYREGAAFLVRNQTRLRGSWIGNGGEVVTTSFSLLFLAKGRSPVLVNKLRHGPGPDWNNDHDDVTNLVGVVSRDWKHLLTWQVVDPGRATVEDLLQAPIGYFNGHDRPAFSSEAKARLREYVEQGGVIVAEACCGRREFDEGFRALMKEVFPEPELELHPLPPDHAVWRSKYRLNPDTHPLWGIEHGCRTVVIYSPDDLSCYWNQLENAPANPRVRSAIALGANIVDYVTGRELPADKLAARDVADFKKDQPRRGALRIAKLRHAGDWNIAPLAIPNLTTTLRDRLKFDVVINHKELFARDPGLVHYPLIYVHGRSAVNFDPADFVALRRHLSPGGGTLFADAACGSVPFDTAFRKFVAELLPGNPLVPIPRQDPFYTRKLGYDLSDAQLTPAAGGKVDLPELEGVQVDGRWAIIYSKYDLGCALQKQAGIECRGYTHESALRIATNIVLYSTLP